MEHSQYQLLLTNKLLSSTNHCTLIVMPIDTLVPQPLTAFSGYGNTSIGWTTQPAHSHNCGDWHRCHRRCWCPGPAPRADAEAARTAEATADHPQETHHLRAQPAIFRSGPQDLCVSWLTHYDEPAGCICRRQQRELGAPAQQWQRGHPPGSRGFRATEPCCWHDCPWQGACWRQKIR